MARIRIGVVAPASRLDPAVVPRIQALVGDYGAELVIHPQCHESWGHFAGTDDSRAEALVAVANDPTLDAVWFARGGYGSARILDRVLPDLGPAAQDKVWLGYSDMGSVLGALYAKGFRRVAHGPMVVDITRAGGEAAVRRALDFLCAGAPETLEPSVTVDARPTCAFNLTILTHLLGTPHLPDLAGHVLMLEEVSEYMYRMDRDLCQLAATPLFRGLAGLRLGRCSDIPPNQPDFAQTVEEMARHWCQVAGIPYLGRADIGHDVDNRVVPFGTWTR